MSAQRRRGEMEETMKVLIISHVPCSSYEAMGITFCSLFKKFEKEELCQLYFYPSIPDVDVCTSYYQITDYDLVDALMIKDVKGRKVNPDLKRHSLYTNEKDARIFSKSNNHSSIKLILRDLLWNKSKVINSNLERWIKSEKPTCIFVAPGGYSFTYDIVVKISEKFNLPIISYICDEYFFVKKQKNLLWNYHQNKVETSMLNFFKKSDHIIGICDEISNSYGKYFNCNATTICTGSRMSLKSITENKSNLRTISYFGNIVGFKRYESLIDVGKCLEEINCENNTNYSLDIYSGDRDQDILNEIRSVKTINFKGYLSGKDFEEAFSNAEILLHVEAFNENTIEQVKNSVSTKIADSLASGIPLLAYAPDNIASINHLKRNKCAFVATNYNELKKAIKLVFRNKELRLQVTKQALKTAKKYHDSERNSKQLREILEKYDDRGK